MKYGFLFLLAVMLAKGDYDIAPPKEPVPNHLFTSRLPSGEESEKRLDTHLNVTDGSLARMVSMPSFTPESCLSVYSRGEGDKQEFFITVTKAQESLSYSVDLNEDPKTKDVKVTRVDRKISRDLANEIHEIWTEVLLKNEAGPTPAGCDGATTRFSAVVKDRGLLTGEIWSPREGLPKEMIKTGWAIIEFAGDKKAGEEPLMKRLKEFEKTIPKP
jgi:hypothetical protein